jgi:ATP-dependent RNA helicase RhlE
MLRDPQRVEVTPVATTADKIDQSIFFVHKENKRRLLAHLLEQDAAMQRVLVFTRTKHGANRLVQHLDRAGFGAEAIHGNKAQSARERALANFKRGDTRVLVATDIAARGIDVDGITHVVNYDLPNIPESYVHRIGRTARAGAAGIAFSFCDGEERAFLKDIEKLIRASIPRAGRHPFDGPPPADRDVEPPRPPRQQQQRARRPVAPRPRAVAPAPAPAQAQATGGQPASGNGLARRPRRFRSFGSVRR